jgi:hypothetical protein
MVDSEETKRKKARELRYRKPIVKNINLDFIREDLDDITCECEDVKWYFDGEDDTLINALDGDEDEAYEFKMMFGDLCAECEQMREDMYFEYIPECFDSLFVAIGAGEKGGGLLGWDSYEQDYFGLQCTDSYAEQKAAKRLKQLTKDQLIQSAQVCFNVYYAYIGLRHRYDCLKASMDILRDQNTGYLQMVRQIEEIYEKANEDRFYEWRQSVKDLERLIQNMPKEAWIQ